MSGRARTQVTTPDALPDERLSDAALRPSGLDEFVGQAKVKESLQIAIDAAKQRGEPLDHTLFFGPPGLGKTTLAQILAHEMGVQLLMTNGPVVEHKGAHGERTLHLRPGLGVHRAVAALRRGNSLLPVGVVRIEGGFARGDAVIIRGPDGVEIGRGLCAYDAEDAQKIRGRSSSDIDTILGFSGRAEMVHRDDLVVGRE